MAVVAVLLIMAIGNQLGGTDPEPTRADELAPAAAAPTTARPLAVSQESSSEPQTSSPETPVFSTPAPTPNTTLPAYPQSGREMIAQDSELDPALTYGAIVNGDISQICAAARPATSIASRRESVKDFVVLFALAIAASDVEFLLDRLHPAVVGGFGLDLCQNWIEAEILQLGDYQLTGPVEGPRNQSFTTPTGTGTIEDAYSAPVTFVFQGQLFNAEGGFVLIGDEMHWLGQCR